MSLPTATAREHLASALADLYRQAQSLAPNVPTALTRAAEHADAALMELRLYGVDVRPPLPVDWR